MSFKPKTQSLLIMTAFTSTVAGSLFWTGFPIAFAQTWNAEASLTSVYALAVAGSVLFDLIAGLFSNMKNARRISIASLLIGSLILFLICIGIHFSTPIFILLLLPFMYFNFSLGNVSENVWLLQFADEKSISSTYLDRSAAVIAAKLIGFSTGPLLFERMGAWGVLICLALMLTTALLQMLIPEKPLQNSFAPSPAQRTWGDSLELLRSLLSRPFLLMSFLLAGLLSVPMNLVFVQRLIALDHSQFVGPFWLSAGLVSLLAVKLLRQKWLTMTVSNMALFLVFSILCCFGLQYSSSANTLLLCGTIYVFISVLLSGALQVAGVAELGKESVGISIGVMNFLMDLGIFLGLLASSKIETELQTSYPPLAIVSVIAVAICVRFLTQFRFMVSSQKKATLVA